MKLNATISTPTGHSGTINMYNNDSRTAHLFLFITENCSYLKILLPDHYQLKVIFVKSIHPNTYLIFFRTY